jgi:anti-sigma factor RsiW
MSISEQELHAYLDGELAPAERQQLEQRLASSPDATAMLEAMKATDERLRAAVLEVWPGEPKRELEPQRLRRRLLERSRMRRGLVVAAISVACVGLLGGWYARGLAGARPMQDAVDAYRVFAFDARRPVELSGENAEELERWLSRRVGRSVSIPNLSTFGLKLLGGRMLSTDEGPAALVLFEDARGARISFYLRPSSHWAPGTQGTRDEVGLLTHYWYRGGYGFAIVGPSGDTRVGSVQASFASAS